MKARPMREGGREGRRVEDEEKRRSGVSICYLYANGEIYLSSFSRLPEDLGNSEHRVIVAVNEKGVGSLAMV